MAALLFGLLLACNASGQGQNNPERLWIAGRYDGSRIIVYFNAVKFGGTIPANAKRLPYAVAEGFFQPVELPPSYLAGLKYGPSAEHFAIGDRYDLLLGNGGVATVTLTTLVGAETDEGVGNDSFVGALGSLDSNGRAFDNRDALMFVKSNHYVLRPHVEPLAGAPRVRPVPRIQPAGLADDPVAFNVQTRMASLLSQHWTAEATDLGRPQDARLPLAFKVQPFRIAGGNLRYYVRAEWKSGRERNGIATHVLAAWMAPLPTLHILGVEKRTSSYDGLEGGDPSLLNVVDLGGGRTAIIVKIKREDSGYINLLVYRDGNLTAMDRLQSVGMGE
jgi:hypothetical protein